MVSSAEIGCFDVGQGKTMRKMKTKAQKQMRKCENTKLFLVLSTLSSSLHSYSPHLWSACAAMYHVHVGVFRLALGQHQFHDAFTTAFDRF